jgi:formate/nitrite transporter
MNFYSAQEVMQNYVELGKKKSESHSVKLLLLGATAGIIVGLSAVVSNTACHAIENPSVARIIGGLLFPFALCMIMLTGTELFTGNCMIFISVLANRTNISGMLRNWFYVYIGNMAGSLFLAVAIVLSGQLSFNDNMLALYTIKTAVGKCALTFGEAIVRGVLCNILVCMGVLCSLSAKDTIGRIIGAYIPVVFFVICGFEHSIANMYYIPAGIMSMKVSSYAAMITKAGLDISQLNWGNYFSVNLLPVTIGNIIGGAGIACLLWFCHARRDIRGDSQAEERTTLL